MQHTNTRVPLSQTDLEVSHFLISHTYLPTPALVGICNLMLYFTDIADGITNLLNSLPSQRISMMCRAVLAYKALL